MTRKDLIKEFDEWVDVTGALPQGTGVYWECRSFLEDAQKEIERLQDKNRELNRRANGMDAYWQGRALKAEAECKMWRGQFSCCFRRMGNTFSEMQIIHYIIEKLRGNENPRYHSVNDGSGPDEFSNCIYARPIRVVDGRECVPHSERVVDAFVGLLKQHSILDPLKIDLAEIDEWHNQKIKG